MSLLAELRNKKKARATATPAIPATRKSESGGGIARIARIAVATEINQKVESANNVDFDAWIDPTVEDEQQPLAIAIPAIPATRELVIDGIHVTDGHTSCTFRTNEGALEYARLVDAGEQDAFHRACAFEDALQALAACGWHGATAENVARAIADGVIDEVVLTAMLEVRHV